MNISQIPRDVVYHHILPKLGWNDILRLRRTSRHFYEIATDYLQQQCMPETIVVEINNDLASLEWTVTGIRPTNIYINNSNGSAFFELEQVQKFASDFGKFVKRVRIRKFPVVPSEAEMSFFAKFDLLKELEIEYIENENITDLVKVMLTNKSKSFVECVDNFDEQLPDSIKGIQTLQFNIPDHEITVEILFYSLVLTRHCHNLKSLAHSYSPPEYFLQVVDFGRFAQCLTQIITHELPQLEVFDAKNLHNISQEMRRTNSVEIAEFLNAIREKSVRMLNFNSDLLLTDGLTDRRFTDFIESMNDVNPIIQRRDTTGIIKLTLTTGRCILDCSTSRAEELNWPNLQTLKITIDSTNLCALKYFSENTTFVFPPVKACELFRYVFSEPKYIQLVELTLEYEEAFVRNAQARMLNIPRVPTEAVAENCPNLRKLILTKWWGTNKALLVLWKKLTSLEEISLIDCENLGNVAFVGEDKDRPAFFNLKGLKKLELRGLDRMPKITDTLFRLVVRHMSLTELVLISVSKIDQITVDGLLTLKTGTFATTIERFSLKHLRLSSANTEEMSSIEKQFRSFNMI